MVKGAGLLKMGAKEAGTHFYIDKLFYSLQLCKVVLYIQRKISFFCHNSFMKKVILSCLKMNVCVCLCDTLKGRGDWNPLTNFGLTL